MKKTTNPYLHKLLLLILCTLSISLTAQHVMVTVPGGTFMMGCTPEQENECWFSEKPAHGVQVDTFNIGKYEVTQLLWQNVMTGNSNGISATPSHFSSCGGSCPVEQVSWYDILVFCNSYSIQQALTPVYTISGDTDPDNWGLAPTSDNALWDSVTVDWTANGYRLPTEAEWEFAARGGNQSDGYKYAGSDTIGVVAWYESNSGNSTHLVGTKTANELGLHDLSGNLEEHVWDWHSFWYFSEARLCEPKGQDTGFTRVLRGGGWLWYASDCRVSSRNHDSPYVRNWTRGFRLCQSN